MLKKPIFYIVIFAFLLRLIFFIWGAELYYGIGKQYINMDSFSYTLSAINLYETGTYTFNFNNEESYYGRLPGYPIIWGALYSIFGKGGVYQAVALLQLILDTITVYLIYLITKRVSGNKLVASFSALLAAAYPFIIVWVTMASTEVLATFLTTFFFYRMLCKEQTNLNIIILGVLVACTFYVREFLGILILPAYFYLFINNSFKLFVRRAILLTFSFASLYVLWPIRNYILFDKIIPVKTYSAGYDLYANDILGARSWMLGWTNEIGSYLDQMADPTVSVEFPSEIFPSPKDKIAADSLINLARKCGTGTYVWKTGQPYPYKNNCNKEIADGFEKLKANYIKANPLSYYTAVPLMNVQKAFFKSQLASNTKSAKNAHKDKAKISNITFLLFSYRTLLILMALVGFWIHRKNKKVYPIVFFFGVIYFFMCFFFRQLEIRYLIQADVIMLVLSGAAFTPILNRFRLNEQIYEEDKLLKKQYI